jgi:DNA-binding NarL/FixJ family response regulator
LRVLQDRADEAAALLDEGAGVAHAYDLHGVVAMALLERARLRRLGDDQQGAARSVIEAIALADRLGDVSGLVDALETLAGIRAHQGRCRTAWRLFAAASAARRNAGIVRPPVQASNYEADVAVARSGLTPEEGDALWEAGAALSLTRAVALAVKYEGRRDSARTGWDAITPTEREVLALVAQGLTNREAAARLVISSRTVETHVANVLAKLGIASRRELARVASAKGFG